jgi:hypothetical protein
MPVALSMRRLCIAASVAALVGCANKPVPLYMWETFPHQQYDTLLRAGASPEEQMQAMEKHMEKARAANMALPPGFRAHLGMLELNAGNAPRAKQLFEAEKTAFPESTPYMDRLLTKLDGQAQSPQAANSDKKPA